jgi:hypothetical protein
VTSLAEIQQSRNRESADAWTLYEPHRQRVTSLLLEALPSPVNDDGSQSRICLLGAGNCNDVDLRRLADRCREVALADLDADALQQAVERQQLEGHPAIQLHSGIDLTGIFDRMAPDSAASEADQAEQIAELTRLAEFFEPHGLANSFDVVASVCLLSQLIDGVIRRFPDPQVSLPLLQAVRRRHLRLLLEHCRPGGTAILFSEVVSSDTCPELTTASDGSLPGLLASLLAAQNFFTGLHPGVILQELQSDASLKPLVANVKPIAPWKWRFLYRTYAVTAFVVQRRE